jgi:hypothetical protein
VITLSAESERLRRSRKLPCSVIPLVGKTPSEVEIR